MDITPLSILVSAYDRWVVKESPGHEVCKSALACLQAAAVESRRRGEKLASIPTLLKHLEVNPAPPFVLLPALPTDGLLRLD
jgi:hypothetical protein